ncbi:polyprotein [Bat hepatovirus SMG18520Minmav2014]|uniref:Genome polyprotein n=6 Tax=Hepatovirus TaxID=12091 RepID=A0A0S1M3C1_9PICO|nr:polyprotein [Bat hepatovirus SMG18520Minmav2014]ALL35275.1 polyprotein [Bat hepatovirus SMG18520Minmav2014]
MENKNKGIFQTVGESLDGILTLADLETEQMVQTPDRVSIAGASYFTSVDQSSVHSSVVGKHQQERLLTSVDVPGSKKTQGEKFFLIHTTDWQTTNGMLTEVAKLDVVKLLYDQQFAVDGFLRYHTYARFGVEVQVQINPTSFQQGGLICALVPAEQGYGSLTCLTVYPHGLLNCNINNVVRIKVPFIYTRGAYNLRDPQYPIWELTIRVWSPLSIGTGTTPYTSLNVLARLTDLELHGLTPIYTQMMRKEFRISTSNNVMNLANYEDARAKVSLALDQEHWLEDSSEAGGLVIKNFSSWTSIPTLATTFAFNASHSVGSQIKVIPVDPYFYQIKTQSPAQNCVTALASVSQMFCFWRGDIVFDFQIFPTKYHSGRLLFCFIPGNENMNVANLTMKQATTAPCAVMDITGVQSTLRFRVPWISDTPYRVNRYTKSEHVKGEYTAIGKLVVFVYNRLSAPSNVASHVMVNVYMSAVNLELFGPIYNAMSVTAEAQAGSDEEEQDDGGFSSTVQAVQNKPDPVGGLTTPKQLKGKANKGKMDLAVGKVPTGAVTTIEDPILAKKIPETFPEKKPGKSRHTSDHMSLYKFMGRAHFLNTFTFNSNNMQYTFPITLSNSLNPPHGLPSTLRWFFSLFHLYRGPLDLSINVTGATDVDGLLWFTPVGLASDTPWKEAISAVSIDYKSSLGAIRFNTRRTGNIQVRLPWYTYLYAISSSLEGFGDKSDTTFGTVSIQIANYTHSDEYLSFAVFLSVTPESQFMFMRAPLNNAVMHESDGRAVSVRTRREAGDLESSVDDPRTKEDREFENEISKQKIPVEQTPSKPLGKPYKDVRMEVGKMRMKYAREEWERMKEKRKSGEMSNFIDDTYMAHSIGNLADYSVVKRLVNGETIRGFVLGKDIWTMASFNLITKKVGVKVKIFQKYTCAGEGYEALDALDWDLIDTPEIVSKALKIMTSVPNWHAAKLSHDVLEALDDPNQEHVLRVAHTDPIWKQMEFPLFKTMLKILRPRKEDPVTRISNALGIKPNADKMTSEISELSKEIMSIIQGLKRGMSRFVYGFNEKKWTFILAFILKLVRAGLFIYLAEQPGVHWDAKILIPIFVIEILDIGLEAVECFRWLSTLFNKSFLEEAEHRKMKLDPDDLEAHASFSQILRDAVSGVVLFRNAKDCICWIFQKFRDWYDERYGEKAKRIQLILKHQEHIENAISVADRFCVQQIQDVEKPKQYDLGVKLLQSLRTVQNMVHDIPELKKESYPISDAINRVHQKLRSFGAINQSFVSRPEPVVCFIYGRRGGGKSLLSMALAVKICKEMGVDPNRNIYTKPVCSDFWDGYSNQLVCIMDDIGQATDDSDWVNFCQLVSGCPLRLNMASIEEKGKHFSSPFIICTSNQDDPSPKTVYVKEAIARRLHVKIKVQPKQYYTDSIGLLNVQLAKEENTIKDMSCVNMITEDGEITLEHLVEDLVSKVQLRKKNMDDFMSLWAQSGDGPKWRFTEDSFEECDDWNDEFEALFPFKKENIITTSLKKFFKVLSSNKWWLIGGALGIAAVALAAWGGYKWYKSKEDKKEREQHEQNVYDPSGVYSGLTKSKRVVKLDQIGKAETQSVVEISGLIHKNLVRFGIGKKGECINWVVNALGVKDEYLLVPSHAYILENSMEDLEFYFERDPTFYSASAGSVEIFTLDTGFQDVVLMRVPNMPKFRDITHHFVQKKDLEKCVNKLATLCTNYKGVYQMISEGPVKLDQHATYAYKDDEGNPHEITVSEAWRGKGNSAPGMCGGALVSSDQKLQNPIIGIHVAGGHGNMISKAIYREMFEVIEKKIPTAQRIKKVEFSQRTLNIGTKTLLKKSPIQDLIDEDLINFPAALPFSKKNDIDPIQVMLSKYDVPIFEEPKGWDECINVFLNKSTQDYTVIRPITAFEAIEGIDGMDGINMKTSPGLPYTLMGLAKDDLIYMDDEGMVEMIHPFLQSRLDLNWMLMDNGNQLDVIYATSPKDELRPLEKVLNSKTRAIEACPLDFTIICRMMWASAISYFQTHPGFTTGIAVGMDPDSDWDSLYKSMHRVGDFGLDLDFSNFDASLSPFMIKSAVEILGVMCGCSDQQNLALFRAISHSKHQILNMIYTVEGSMPSGTPCTSLLNSIINNLCIIFVFSKILSIKPYQLEEVMKWITYGDDVLIVFNREVKFDFSNVAGAAVRGFKEIGLTATSSAKGEPEVCPIYDLSFLKRKFYHEDGRFRPSISEKTIWSLVAWKRTNAEFEENVKTACWFAFLKGFDYYEKFTCKLRDLLRMAGVQMHIFDYNHWKMRFDNQCFERDMD